MFHEFEYVKMDAPLDISPNPQKYNDKAAVAE